MSDDKKLLKKKFNPKSKFNLTDEVVGATALVIVVSFAVGPWIYNHWGDIKPYIGLD